MPEEPNGASMGPPRGWLDLIWLRYLPAVAVLVGLFAFQSAWMAILLYHAGIIVGVFKYRSRLERLDWGSNLVIPLSFLFLGLVAGPLVYYALPSLTSDEVGETVRSQLLALGLEGASLYGFVLYFVLIHPTLEELAWRGIIFFQGLRPHYTDFEFAAYHLLVLWWLFPGNWVLLLVSFLVLSASGWAWRQIRDRFGFRSVIAFHAASDFAVLLAAGKLAGIPPFG